MAVKIADTLKAMGVFPVVDTKGMPPTSDFKLKWKMMKYKYPMYTYKCLKGIGRDKRKGIMHYQNWEQVKGC